MKSQLKNQMTMVINNQNEKMRKLNQMLLSEMFIVPIATMKGITPKNASHYKNYVRYARVMIMI